MKKSATKKILLIDIDEVIVGCYVIRFYNEYFEIDHSPDKFSNPDIHEEFKDPGEKQRFMDYVFTKDLYIDSVFKEDAVDVIKKLNEKYMVYICSDFLIKGYEWQSDKEFIDKWNFLKRHFSFLSPSQFIFTRAKTLLNADILIDDRPHNFGPHIKQKLLFTSYHNKDISDKELRKNKLMRVNSWSEIGKLLLG